MVGLIAPGTEVGVVLIRDREERRINVEVGGLNADDDIAGAYRGDEAEDEAGGGRLGIVVDEVPDEMLDRFELEGGVLVRGVQPDSPADRAGLQQGDVITAVGSTPVRSVEALLSAVRDLDAGASVPLRLMRRGQPLFIGLRLED